MASEQIANNKDGADIYHGEALCKQKSVQLLTEMSLPKGLLPLDDVVEVGYNRVTGFVWLRQKSSKEHKFREIGRVVFYDTEVTAFVEERMMRRVTGVKSKELLIWVTISEICVDDASSGTIIFATPTGLSRAFPLSTFEIEEKNNG